MEEGVTGAAVLALPVRVHGIQLGRPVDLLLGDAPWRVVGIDVLCRDGGTRFVPVAAAHIRDGEIELASALLMLDDSAFYRRQTRSLRALRGAPVERDRRPAGTVADVVVSSDGAVTAVVVRTGAGTHTLTLDGAVVIAGDARRAA